MSYSTDTHAKLITAAHNLVDVAERVATVDMLESVRVLELQIAAARQRLEEAPHLD